jgi:hypothetical protein
MGANRNSKLCQLHSLWPRFLHLGSLLLSPHCSCSCAKAVYRREFDPTLSNIVLQPLLAVQPASVDVARMPAWVPARRCISFCKGQASGERRELEACEALPESIPPRWPLLIVPACSPSFKSWDASLRAANRCVQELRQSLYGIYEIVLTAPAFCAFDEGSRQAWDQGRSCHDRHRGRSVCH